MRRMNIGIITLLILSGWFPMPTLVSAQVPHSQITAKDGPVSMHAEGTFDVKNTPLPGDEALTGTAIGRYGLDKQFHGDLEASSKGEMLGAGNPATGTAGYVAIEQVTGTLHGRTGSFALQHCRHHGGQQIRTHRQSRSRLRHWRSHRHLRNHDHQDR